MTIEHLQDWNQIHYDNKRFDFGNCVMCNNEVAYSTDDDYVGADIICNLCVRDIKESSPERKTSYTTRTYNGPRTYFTYDVWKR